MVNQLFLWHFLNSYVRPPEGTSTTGGSSHVIHCFPKAPHPLLQNGRSPIDNPRAAAGPLDRRRANHSCTKRGEHLLQTLHHLDLDTYAGFLKYGYPEIIHFNGIFSIDHPFGGTPHYRKPPYDGIHLGISGGLSWNECNSKIGFVWMCLNKTGNRRGMCGAAALTNR